MNCKPVLITSFLLLLAPVVGGAQSDIPPDLITEEDRPYLLNYPSIEDSDGRVVLTNEHVVLQRLYVAAGEWEGLHSHPGNQIYVHIEGGEWSGRLGGEIEYWGTASPDGGIGWMDPIPLSAGHESGNTGETDIDLIYVTLKSDSPIAPEADHAPQKYPHVQPELLLDNDRMIVQRIFLEAGQWTGAHVHPGNQLFLVIKGGIRSERRSDGSVSSSLDLAAGSVGWIGAMDGNRAHDVGNTGETTMEIVLVTIK